MCLHLSSLSKLSAVSVVFDFNASLNDVAPLFPITFPVDFRSEKSEWLMNDFCVSSFFCLYNPDRV